MRKSIITICAIVLLTAALCVYTTATLNDSVAHLQSIAADMQQNFDNGDYAACMDDAQRLWNRLAAALCPACVADSARRSGRRIAVDNDPMA